MYLGSSKYWWAYLGLLSNPTLRAAMRGEFDRAVLFDELGRLTEAQAERAGRSDRYFFFFWDGIQNASLLRQAREMLGPEAVLSAIYVGVNLLRPEDDFGAQSLYPEGPLLFAPLSASDRLDFDVRTADRMRRVKLKNWLIPFKNLSQNPGTIASQFGLLAGSRKIVFCGSYGTIPAVIASFCERYAVNPEYFRDYPYYIQEKKPSYPTYLQYLASDGLFLSQLLDRDAIDGSFFSAAVHLLGREYFIERIRETGVPFFVNGYATGVNVNVYTTPFYRQHLYVDFGSVVGRGNYPRLADLQYFRKDYVEIPVTGELPELSELARAGRLGSYFEAEWHRCSPELLAGMLEG